MSTSPADMLQFFSLIGKLKHLKRTGWVRNGIKEPEDVAGHMYRMAIMSMIFSQQSGLDGNRCIKLSLVHDMAESIVGDITPSCNVTKEEKQEKEKLAMLEIKKLVGGQLGDELYNYWEEYEFQTTEESKIVKDLDRFDMIHQAFEYEQENAIKLQEFFDSTEGTFQNEVVKDWVKELNRQRQEFYLHDKILKDS